MTNTYRNQSLTQEDYVYDADNKLLQAGNTQFEYGANGRLQREIQDGSVKTYHYNLDGTLAGVDLPDGTSITYQHDAPGRRVTKTVNGGNHIPLVVWKRLNSIGGI